MKLASVSIQRALVSQLSVPSAHSSIALKPETARLKNITIMTIILVCTCASDSISYIACVAGTEEASNEVITTGINITVVRTHGTFIDIYNYTHKFNDIYNVVKERCFTVVITYSDMCRQQSCSQRCKCIYMSQSHYCTLQQKDKG